MTLLPPDEFDVGAQPNCPMCGTVMRNVGGGYGCSGCGLHSPVASIDHPGDGDVPGIHGG